MSKRNAKMALHFSSVKSLDRLGLRGDTRDCSAEVVFQCFLLEDLVMGLGRGDHSLRLSIQHFTLPTTASSTSEGALKDGFDVVACDMPEPFMFPSLDSCQKRFLWTHGEG